MVWRFAPIFLWLSCLTTLNLGAQPASCGDGSLLGVLHNEHLSKPLPAVERGRTVRAESLWCGKLASRRKPRGFWGMLLRDKLGRQCGNTGGRESLRSIRQDADFWAQFNDAFLYALLSAQSHGPSRRLSTTAVRSVRK